MAGVISPSMPVFIIENKAFGNLAYCTQNEGLGKVLRYGGMGPEVYARLKWMETDLYPALDRALQTLPDGIDLRSLIAQALHMGDECHNRNRAATSLFLRAIGPALARTNRDNETLAKVIEFIDRNDHFFLNLSMPAGKAMLEPAEGVEGSTIVTVMARNGTDFGIRLSSMPERWFTAPAGQVQGLYFPQYTEKDANPDIGDSTVTETAGYGGMAMAAAPAITKFVGGTPQTGAAGHAGNVRNHLRRARAIHHPGAQFPRHAVRHRRAQGDGNRHPAPDQHRHRPQRSRRGHGGRGHPARPGEVLPRCI